MIPVAIVATGVANTASVCAALERLGCAPALVVAARAIRDAERLVLPGVGAFAAAMQTLREAGWAEALRQRIADGRPTLAVCLGLQLLGLGSEEDAGTPGLGCVPVTSARFPDDVRVPHMGWNQVEPEAACDLLQPGAVYFAHSYRWPAAPAGSAPAGSAAAGSAAAGGAAAGGAAAGSAAAGGAAVGGATGGSAAAGGATAGWTTAGWAAAGWAAAHTTYGEPFVAAVERGTVLACQFHPELSGAYGAELLRRWLRAGGAAC